MFYYKCKSRNISLNMKVFIYSNFVFIGFKISDDFILFYKKKLHK